MSAKDSAKSQPLTPPYIFTEWAMGVCTWCVGSSNNYAFVSCEDLTDVYIYVATTASSTRSGRCVYFIIGV